MSRVLEINDRHIRPGLPTYIWRRLPIPVLWLKGTCCLSARHAVASPILPVPSARSETTKLTCARLPAALSIHSMTSGASALYLPAVLLSPAWNFRLTI